MTQLLLETKSERGSKVKEVLVEEKKALQEEKEALQKQLKLTTADVEEFEKVKTSFIMAITTANCARCTK